MSTAVNSSISRCLREKQAKIQQYLAAIAEVDATCSQKVSELIGKGSEMMKKINEAVETQNYARDEFFGSFLTPHSNRVYVDIEKLERFLLQQGFATPERAPLPIVNPPIFPLPSSVGSNEPRLLQTPAECM